MKNIILITADSLRADHCNPFGYDCETMPRLSNYDSAKFTKARANAPTTILSIPSILTGKYPLEHGHPTTNPQNTVLDKFQETDYTTGLFTSNIQLTRFGYEEQFDTMECLIDGLNEENNKNPFIRAGRWALRKGGLLGPLSIIAKEKFLRFTGPMHRIPSDKELFDRATQWLDSITEPYFLWLHLMDTHNPYYFEQEDFEAISDADYNPAQFAQIHERALTDVRSGKFRWTLSDEQKEYLIDSYDASIRHVDQLIGKFVDGLDLTDTSVIISSDHGEEFWDHGYFGHNGRSEYPRSMTLYEEMLHVPLLILGDDIPDTTISAPVSLVDLYPTITDMAGLDSERDSHHGKSLYPVALGEETLAEDRQIIAQVCSPAEPSVYTSTENRSHLAALYEDDLKYIYNECQEDELYCLSEDSGEINNVIDTRPGTSTDYISTLRQHMKIGEESTAVDVDTEVKKNLKDLGYMG